MNSDNKHNGNHEMRNKGFMNNRRGNGNHQNNASHRNGYEQGLICSVAPDGQYICHKCGPAGHISRFCESWTRSNVPAQFK